MSPTRVILGIHDGHNASACFLIDGRVRYLVQEERLRYVKNAWGFPSDAIRDGMKRLGLGTGDLDVIAFDMQTRLTHERDLKDVMRSFQRLLEPVGLARMALIRATAPALLRPVLRRRSMVRRRALLAECGLCGDRAVAYNHHLCHAAAAYYAMRCDPDVDHLVLTLDGAGERYCSTASTASRGDIRQFANTSLPHSLGSIYAVVTYLMGFVPYEHEYKLMGMAPYCSESNARDVAEIFHRYLELRPDGLGFRKKRTFGMNMQGRRWLRDLRLKRFDAVAAGVQRFTEDLVVDWTRHCLRKTGLGRVVLGGGVFMNVKANKRLMELEEISYLGALPSCGDESTSYGAAALAHRELDGANNHEPWGAIYFGPSVDDAEAEARLRQRGWTYSRPEDIELEIARLLAAGRPVARCRGAMEFGARALGNRSILADPSLPDCVRVINQMVKKRDFWMPFAPMMTAERADEYLVNPKRFASPHMMLSFDTRDTYPQFIAALHNADLTARAQILEPHHNPDMYRCLKHFEQLTGRAVVLNTSFNLHGYPVVLGPKEALHVFENSGLEFLALGSFMVRK